MHALVYLKIHNLARGALTDVRNEQINKQNKMNLSINCKQQY